jgi:hypothetical protein
MSYPWQGQKRTKSETPRQQRSVFLFLHFHSCMTYGAYGQDVIGELISHRSLYQRLCKN